MFLSKRLIEWITKYNYNCKVYVNNTIYTIFIGYMRESCCLYIKKKEEEDIDITYQRKTVSLCLPFIFWNKNVFPERSRDIVISTCAADGVPFSFVFCRDSCTPPGPDGSGRIPHSPDNEKKEPEQELKREAWFFQ